MIARPAKLSPTSHRGTRSCPRTGRGDAAINISPNLHQAPREHEDGHPARNHLRLELKLLDVGLSGLSKRRQSTLISVISAARPKIATILSPRSEAKSRRRKRRRRTGGLAPNSAATFVVADSGLIEARTKARPRRPLLKTRRTHAAPSSI